MRRMLEATGRFTNRRTRTANKDYDRFFIYVPVEVARDSAFPFEADEPVVIKVDADRKRLIVEKQKKKVGGAAPRSRPSTQT